MVKTVTPAEMMRLSMQMGLMAMEAQTVITLRMLGMMGMWNTAPGENSRMLSEKTSAMVAAQMAAGRSIAAGGDAAAVAMAALRPIRAKTRANAARLTKRGPKSPL